MNNRWLNRFCLILTVGLFAKKSVEFKQFIFPLRDIDLMRFTVITQIQIKHKKSSWKMIMKRHLTNCSGIYIKNTKSRRCYGRSRFLKTKITQLNSLKRSTQKIFKWHTRRGTAACTPAPLNEYLIKQTIVNKGTNYKIISTTIFYLVQSVCN